MKVLGLVWVGVRTDRFHDMAAFLENTLGLSQAAGRDGFREYRLPNADTVELFATADPERQHMTTGPVPGFLISDIVAASAELRDAGVELIGALQRAGDYAWQHFRAPDGTVYELVEDRRRLGTVG